MAVIDPIALAAIPALLAAPGPTNALLATASATHSTIGPVRAIGAVIAGYVVAITVLRLVGAPLTAASPLVLPAIRLALAAWLGVIAFGLWRHGAGPGGGPIDARRLFGTTLLNPKAAIFAFGFFPETTESLRLAAWGGWLVGAIVVSGALWWSLGRLARPIGDGPRRLVPRLAALVLAGFGLALAGTTLAAAG
jgi:threonine/homoserine/homoserine lactone efflux protein